jgi:hypothetical protein
MLPEGKLPARSASGELIWRAINCREHASRLRDLRCTVGELIDWAILFVPFRVATHITSANAATSMKVKFWTCLDFRLAELLKGRLWPSRAPITSQKNFCGKKVAISKELKCRKRCPVIGQAPFLNRTYFRPAGSASLLKIHQTLGTRGKLIRLMANISLKRREPNADKRQACFPSLPLKPR